MTIPFSTEDLEKDLSIHKLFLKYNREHLDRLAAKSRQDMIDLLAKAEHSMTTNDTPTKRPHTGPAPDTSLNLGQARREWLIKQGGIQPTIKRLIDQAMAALKRD